jgi:hypothetical protein
MFFFKYKDTNTPIINTIANAIPIQAPTGIHFTALNLKAFGSGFCPSGSKDGIGVDDCPSGSKDGIGVDDCTPGSKDCEGADGSI